MILHLMVNRWVEVVMEAVRVVVLAVVAMETLPLAETEAHTCNLKG